MERTKINGQTKQNPEQLASRMQTLSAVTARLKLASSLGQSYGGDRDVYEALGYPKDITFQNYLDQYKRQDIAKAIIDRPVKATWQGELKVVEDDHGRDEQTEFERRWDELNKRLGLKTKFARLDKLACLGKYAVLLLGFDDSRNNWDKPVTDGHRKLLYVRTVSEANIEINKWEQDARQERYGQPKLYKLTMKAPGQDHGTYDLLVHHSRVIHVVTDPLEDAVEGEPVLKPAFNRLKDLEKLVGGSAEMFWRGARPGYAGKTDPEFTISDDDASNLEDQIEEYENNLRRFLMTEGVELKSLATQIADPSNHVDIQLQMLSAMTGIPRRVLIGTERGDLASSQDKNEWNEIVQTRRDEHADVNIVRPFVGKMLKYQVLPEPQQGYKTLWSNLFKVSKKEQVNIGKSRARALKDYAGEPEASRYVPIDTFLKYFLGFEQEEAQAVVREIGQKKPQPLPDTESESEEEQITK